METELQTYRTAVTAHYDLWALYMSGLVGPHGVARWPEHPTRTPHPRPEIAWHYRPPQVPKDSACPDYYNLRYKDSVDIGGVRFRRGTGRNVKGRATRNGRINWPETTKRAQAWQEKERTEKEALENALRSINKKAGTAALHRLPSVDFAYREGKVKIIKIPKGGYACMVSYRGDVTISDLYIWHGNFNNTAKEALGVHNLPRDFVAQVLDAVSAKWA